MKKGKNITIIMMIQIFLLGINLNAQSIINFDKFPVSANSEEPLKADELLKAVEWERVKEYAKNNDGHYAYERKDSLRNEYEYVQQGRMSYFEIVSFNGNVLEFYSEIRNTSKPSKISYFDKNVWMSYVEYKMPNLDERFKISIEKSESILRAYYALIGVDSRDEYGWICEYSAAGMPPERRSAVIELLGETEILISLLDFPNIQTQLYVADALIFDDFRTKEMINEAKNKGFKRYLKSELMSKDIWKKISLIRDKNELVKICGNAGSYKIYKSNTSELLSKKSIEKIIDNYQMLDVRGFLR